MPGIFNSYSPYREEDERQRALQALAQRDQFETYEPIAQQDMQPPAPEPSPPEPVAADEPEPVEEPAPEEEAEEGPIAAPAAEPVAAQAQRAPSPLELLSQRLTTQPQTYQAPNLPPPPRAEATPPWAMVTAGLLDLALNKGANAPRIMMALAQGDQAADYENYKRQAQYAKDMNTLAYRGRGGTARGTDPMTLALRAEALRLQQDRLNNQVAAEQRHKMEWEALNTVGSPQHKAMLDWAVKNRLGTYEELAGLPYAAMVKFNPAINDYLKNTGEIGRADVAHAAEKSEAVLTAGIEPKATTARRIGEETLPVELEKIRAGTLARGEAEAQTPEFQAKQSERFRAAADQYAKETHDYRGAAQQVQRAKGIADKYKGGNIPGLGMMEGRFIPDSVYAATNNRDALEVRSAQRLMNDIVTRAQTGAAAPVSEQQAIQMMTGSKPGATEAEFLIGLQAMEDYTVGHMRAYAAGKEDAAWTVLHNQGLDQMVFPADAQPQQPQPAPATRQPRRPPRPPRRQDTEIQSTGATDDDVRGLGIEF